MRVGVQPPIVTEDAADDDIRVSQTHDDRDCDACPPLSLYH
jgi:hypothetical protein